MGNCLNRAPNANAPQTFSLSYTIPGIPPLSLFCVFQRNKTLGLLLGAALKLTSFHPGLLCFEPIKYGVIKTSPKGHPHPKPLRTQSLHL